MNPNVVSSCNIKKCFVSIGFPNVTSPGIYEKVLVPLHRKETKLDAALRFRERVFKELKDKGSTLTYAGELYFLIFENYSDTCPSGYSDNAEKKVLDIQVKNRYGATKKRKSDGLRASSLTVDEYEKIGRASDKSGFSADALIKSMEEPLLTAKELFIIGKEI